MSSSWDTVAWDNTWARDLAWLCVEAEPVAVPAPRLLAVNDDLAAELGLDPDQLRTASGIGTLSGSVVPEGARPLSQAYAGHQFGSFNPLLGDGRAHLLGEVVDTAGHRRDIALKGSGRTPFSRGGDGRAAVGPVLREFLVSEAMHALGIPTTRALAAVATGAAVQRDRSLPGAVLTRVAASHLRIGTVELVRTRGTTEQLAALVEYARARHYPDVSPGDALGLLSGVIRSQAELVAAWMSVGFVHGVMNTDNMTLSGETIDFGPCAFLDAYQPDKWFSSIDSGGRYRYSAQPYIASWNLTRLAEALLPVIHQQPGDAATLATARLETFTAHYEQARLRRFRSKLGLADGNAADPALVDDLLSLLAVEGLDFTTTFRGLSTSLRGRVDPVRARVRDRSAYQAWQRRWRERLGLAAPTASPTDPSEADRSGADRSEADPCGTDPFGADPSGAAVEPSPASVRIADAMDAVNPVHIPRNHLVEEALTAAPEDLRPFDRLLAAVRSPYSTRVGLERFAEPAALDFQHAYVTFCGT